MYERKYNKEHSLTRYAAFKEYIAIHSMAHHYLCQNHSEASKYIEQERRLSLVLLDTNTHVFDKLIANYLNDYPQPF